VNICHKNVFDWRRGSSLSYGEAIADARVCAVDERQQIAKDARDGFGGFGNSFPTFWSAGAEVKGVRRKPMRLLELIGIISPQRFQSMDGQNRNKNCVAFSQSFYAPTILSGLEVWRCD
jgi:hypothetical protein